MMMACQKDNSLSNKDEQALFSAEPPEYFSSSAFQAIISKRLDTEEDNQGSFSLSECCECTMSITNLSSIYKVGVILQPAKVNPMTCTPLYLSAVLDPGQKKSVNGFALSEGDIPGQPDIFILTASNELEGQSDCVRLRVVIDCGENVYDKSFKMDQHLPPNYYHVAQFDVDAGGQPNSCSLVPLNLSFNCRNSPNQLPADCLPACDEHVPNG